MNVIVRGRVGRGRVGWGLSRKYEEDRVQSRKKLLRWEEIDEDDVSMLWNYLNQQTTPFYITGSYTRT